MKYYFSKIAIIRKYKYKNLSSETVVLLIYLLKLKLYSVLNTLPVLVNNSRRYLCKYFNMNYKNDVQSVADGVSRRVETGLHRLDIRRSRCEDKWSLLSGSASVTTVLLLPAIRNVSGEFFIFQQDSAPAHRARLECWRSLSTILGRHRDVTSATDHTANGFAALFVRKVESVHSDTAGLPLPVSYTHLTLPTNREV